MVSQTLEILRQGVWASLTGGWFFDPHQDVYCNTFHLYLWMFLLCFPFTIYLYSPPEEFLWYVYCVLVTIVFGMIKLVNLGLHHMYDTTECIQIETEDNRPESERRQSGQIVPKRRREEEGIELQELSSKRLSEDSSTASFNAAFMDYMAGVPGPDRDSLDSVEYPKHTDATAYKVGSTIDLKVDVHRKNSSESSEEMAFRPTDESAVAQNKETQTSGVTYQKLAEKQVKQPSSTPGSDCKLNRNKDFPLVEDSFKRHRHRTNSIIHGRRPRKLTRQTSVDSQDSDLAEPPGIVVSTTSRRQINATNGSLGCLPAADEVNIKPTGSLELGYIEYKNPSAQLTAEEFSYWKNNNRAGVRRIRSTALEICCSPATNLVPQPNSLEVIGATQGPSNRNHVLPPPSSTLVRNPHLSLGPYFSYGSEIVYPIAEQSDEHQTSHGPDTDLESVQHNSDSDYEEQNTGSRSPLLVRLDPLESGVKLTEGAVKSRIEVIKKNETKDKRKSRKTIKSNTLVEKNSANSYSTGALDNNSAYYHKHFDSQENVERTSATSKDALLENDVSNSSATPEMHDARTDCNVTDNDNSEKKLSACSLCSDSDGSVEEHEEKCEIFMTKLEQNNASIGQKTTCTNQAIDVCDESVAESSGRCVKPRKCIATYDCQTVDLEHQIDCYSIDGLNCLFETSDSEPHLLSETKDLPLKDADSRSSSTISLESDIPKFTNDDSFKSRWFTSKLPGESSGANTNLGAVPKYNRHLLYRPSLRESEHEDRRARINSIATKHDCERRPRRRHSNRDRESTPHADNSTSTTLSEVNVNLASNRVSYKDRSTRTAKLIPNQSSLSGLESLVNNTNTNGQRPTKRSLSRNNSKTVNRTRRRNSSCNEASSSSSNNELSTLLPAAATPLLAAFLENRRNMPACMSSRNCGDSVLLRPVSPPQHCRLKRTAPVSRRIRTNTHIAASHNDTSDGSMHCFRDENGSWWTYTFDERGTGVGLPFAPANSNGRLLHTLLRQQHHQNQLSLTGTDIAWQEPADAASNSSLSLNSSGLTVVLDSSITPIQSTSYAVDDSHISPLQTEGRTAPAPPSSQGETDTDPPKGILRNWDYIPTTNYVFPEPKYYYKYKLWPRTHIKIYTDRLGLLALLDRNLSFWETILSIILASMVACFGATMLRLKFYEDLCAFLFCFVIAGCQYSLMKSVQPDAASPTHGFNRIMAFSRPVYFCMCSSSVIILHYSILNKSQETTFPVYGVYLSNKHILNLAKDVLATCLLCFPIGFSLGLCPQINTFTMYLLEQIDMHIFGGNAMSSLVAAFYSVFRSIMAVLILYGFAYGALVEEKCAQHILFSMFCGCLIPCAYHLSRCASDPANMWYILKTHFWPPDIYREPNRKLVRDKVESKPEIESKKEIEKSNLKLQTLPTESASNSKCSRICESELIDPLPQKLQKTVNLRLKNDILICSVMSLLVFGLHTTSVFSVLKPEVCDGFKVSLVIFGFILHYVLPQLRKQLPWLCIARPVLRSHEHGLFEVRDAARVMWFEKVHVYFCSIERNFLYPVLFLITLTQDARIVNEKFGSYGAAFILVICGLKVIRGSYSDCSNQYLILGFTTLFFRWDFASLSETFLVDYFLVAILFNKATDLLLKLQFVVTYIAPWQITWGSAFHAFAQPFSVPHSAMLFLQTILSAILSTPLNPFLGSAIFLTSYVRPIKFWERDYNTRRVDHSNTRLSSHLDRNLGADDNNLNSIFYEHLTRSLQHSLCGDLMLGRWGHVSQGDCFVLASDYLNCLVHIIEKGNGLVTFQMRGLEFRGTYCQQREVEAISEGVEENDGCCCCEPGHLPHMLSVNAAFSQRWLAWEVTASKYVLEGYSISDNSAVSMLQVFDFRKVLITYYVKSIIFYVTRSPKLDDWLKNQSILDALSPIFDRNFVDLDPVFNINIDEDFDFRCAGITRNSFCNIYHEWIQYCASKRSKNLECDRDSSLVLLCFALSLLGRRTLGAASHNTVSSVEFFLYGLHALFKGDFRITSMRDEWVFTDVELLRKVVAPAVRMSLKLHQDHFREPDEYEESAALFLAISNHNENLVISHEGDPAWRNAVLSGTPSLLALRHVLDEGTDEYKIIMLNKRFLSFRVIKINRECVRGLWSGQQQELVYLRNRNPERGSIQNAKQALRNIINSSCDQPIGYPIYVSPLTTSYAETNLQLCNLVGGSLTLKNIKNNILKLWKTFRRRCGEGCLSGGSIGRTAEEGCFGNEGIYAMTACTLHGSLHSAPGHSTDTIRAGSLSRGSLGGNRGSMISVGKPASSTLANLAGLLSEGGSFNRKERREDLSVSTSTGLEHLTPSDPFDQKQTPHRVQIIDPNVVYDAINLGRRIDVTWPDEKMRARGGRSYWKDWLPEKGMEGTVVHRWVPNHRDPHKRSHVDRTILLVKIDDKYVPIAESAVQDLGAEV